jgi:hypothetical protein
VPAFIEENHVKRTTLLGALPLAALALAVPSTASAAPSTTSFSQVIGSVQLDPADPTHATVQARYRCTGGPTSGCR